MVDRNQLRDETSHRRTDDVRGFDAEGVEQSDSIVGHVIQAVCRFRVAAKRSRHVRGARRLHSCGQAGVAIVVADDVEAAGRELLAEVLFPAEHLGAEAHHEQERCVFRIPKRLVLDVDPVGSRSWHAPNGMTYP